MANNDKIIVWEWHSKYLDRYQPYEAFISNFIEDRLTQADDKTNHDHVVDLKSIDPCFHGNHEIDLHNMVQKNRLTGSKCSIRRSVYSQTSTAAQGIEWQWMGDNKQWEVYDIEVASIIEKAFRNKKEVIDLRHTKCRFPYTIDFTKMVQIRDRTGYHRLIKRVRVQMGTYKRLICAPSNSRHSIQSTTSPSAANPISSSNTAGANISTSSNDFNAVIASNIMRMQHNAKIIQLLSLTEKLFLLSYRNSLAMSNTANSLGSGYSAGSLSYNLNLMTGIPITMQPPFSSSMLPLHVPPSASSNPFSAQVGQTTSAQVGQNTFTGQTTSAQVGQNTFTGQTPSAQVGQHTFTGQTPNAQVGQNTFTGQTLNAQVGQNSSTGQTTLPIIDYHTVNNYSYADNDIYPGALEDRHYILDLLKPISTTIWQLQDHHDDTCAICMRKFKETSQCKSVYIIELNNCKHSFHRECVVQLVKTDWKNDRFKCPTCKTTYWTVMGDCPRGTMTYWCSNSAVAGYDGYGSIQIEYDIQSGVQTIQHPNPGKPFTAKHFPRNAYLPHTKMGRLVLQLLIIAWKRKMTFTINKSVNLGISDYVVWNDIPHITSPTDNIAHGNPGGDYLDKILIALARRGIGPRDDCGEQL